MMIVLHLIIKLQILIKIFTVLKENRVNVLTFGNKKGYNEYNNKDT